MRTAATSVSPRPRRLTALLVGFRGFAVTCAVATGCLSGVFSGLPFQSVRERSPANPLLYVVWIDGGVLSHKNAWIVDLYRRARWLPILASKQATVEVRYRTAVDSELHVDLEDTNGFCSLIVQVADGERGAMNLR